MMNTYMAKPATVEKKWYVIDASGLDLGICAAEVAKILRGKNKTTFTPHVDCGDYVILINRYKLVLTGKKFEKKYFKR
ncbi:MAG: 50S ribosomal protein L13, partial [Clostridia bacterium]|nr:50S ribosomal protein L13 [Clostridia bacterium]